MTDSAFFLGVYCAGERGDERDYRKFFVHIF
jgi:hypothetical protein